MKMSKSQKAAMKAWKTRRANDNSRHNAAKKAWVTRKENEEIEEEMRLIIEVLKLLDFNKRLRKTKLAEFRKSKKA